MQTSSGAAASASCRNAAISSSLRASGELSGHMRHQTRWRHGRAWQQLYEGHDFLVARDSAPDHCRLNHCRMPVQHRFDLGWVDVEAGADDQLLGAARDKQDVAVEAREIAGVEPSIPVN